MLLLTLLLLFPQFSNSTPMEIVVVISGSQELAGHPAKIYQPQIKKILKSLTLRLPKDSELASVYGKGRKDVYKSDFAIIQPLTLDRDKFENVTNSFLSTVPVAPDNLNKGVSGAIDYALDNVFNSIPVKRAILILAHFTLSTKELQKMVETHQREHIDKLYLAIFPWGQQPCSTVLHSLKSLNQVNNGPEETYCTHSSRWITSFLKELRTDYRRRKSKKLNNEITTTTEKVPLLVLSDEGIAGVIGTVFAVFALVSFPIATWVILRKQTRPMRRNHTIQMMLSDHSEALLGIVVTPHFHQIHTPP